MSGLRQKHSRLILMPSRRAGVAARTIAFLSISHSRQVECRHRAAGEQAPMTEWRKIDIRPGLVFDALVAGAADAPLVLLLHGFAQSLHAWRAQLPALAAAGFRAVAPSQRGYSPGARPDMTDVANYRFDLLVADALAIVAACGRAEGRFHL